MRREKVRSLVRRYAPPRHAYAVRFSFDNPGTVRILPSEWTDKADRSIGIHVSVPVDGLKLEAFEAGPMEMLRADNGNDATMFAFVAIFGNAGILFGPDEWELMQIFRVSFDVTKSTKRYQRDN